MLPLAHLAAYLVFVIRVGCKGDVQVELIRGEKVPVSGRAWHKAKRIWLVVYRGHMVTARVNPEQERRILADIDRFGPPLLTMPAIGWKRIMDAVEDDDECIPSDGLLACPRCAAVEASAPPAYCRRSSKIRRDEITDDKNSPHSKAHHKNALRPKIAPRFSDLPAIGAPGGGAPPWRPCGRGRRPTPPSWPGPAGTSPRPAHTLQGALEIRTFHGLGAPNRVVAPHRAGTAASKTPDYY